MNNKSTRYIYIDILNILACFFVIILHSTSVYFMPNGSHRWLFASALQSVCICAVPIFFLIAGAMLVEYRNRYSTAAFFKKRISKVVIPFLIWTIIYAVWKQYTGQIKIDGINDFIHKFLNNEILTIFWFFYAIIGIYTAIPVISIFIKHCSTKMAYFYLALCLFNASIIPLLNRVANINLSKFAIPVCGSSMVYIILGWLISKDKLKINKRWILLIMAFLSSCVMFFSTIYYSLGKNAFIHILKHGSSNAKGTLDRTFITSTGFFCVILAGCVFMLIKSIDWEKLLNEKTIKFIHILASTSYGVYLIQKIVMYYIAKIEFVDIFSPLYSTIGAVIIYFICVFIVFILKKIPLFKYIIP